MTAVNHALTGAAIGLLVGEPWLAVPIALMSHFVCDALPHWRTSQPENRVLKSGWFPKYLALEAAACLVLVATLASFRPLNWQLAAVCAFVAAAPDLASFNRYWATRHGRLWKPSLYGRFASRIQWFERPVGSAVEIAWFVAAILVIAPFLS